MSQNCNQTNLTPASRAETALRFSLQGCDTVTGALIPNSMTIIHLHEMTTEQLAEWYNKLNYFSMCQLQSAFGYSSIAGFTSAIARGEQFSVKQDKLGNVWPTAEGVKEWQKD